MLIEEIIFTDDDGLFQLIRNLRGWRPDPNRRRESPLPIDIAGLRRGFRMIGADFLRIRQAAKDQPPTAAEQHSQDNRYKIKSPLARGESAQRRKS